MEVNVLSNVDVKVALHNRKCFYSCVVVFNKLLTQVPSEFICAVSQLYLLCPNLAHFVPSDY